MLRIPVHLALLIIVPRVDAKIISLMAIELNCINLSEKIISCLNQCKRIY